MGLVLALNGILQNSLDKVLQPSVPQCPCLLRGDDNIHLIGLL